MSKKKAADHVTVMVSPDLIIDLNAPPKAYKGRFDKINQANADGYGVNFGDDLTLQLDIDEEYRLHHAKELLIRFKKILNIANVTMTRSKNNLWHLYVHLKTPIPKKERMLLQGLLGSDPVREILNWKYEPSTGTNECFLIEPNPEDETLVKV